MTPVPLLLFLAGTSSFATDLDRPWNEVSAQLSTLGQSGGSDSANSALLSELTRRLPELVRQWDADSKHPEWFGLWGQSINFDELAKGEIVDPAILAAIATRLGIAFHDPKIVHAGMEHTYGYLFSTLKTPYGYKRARWVGGEIEAGFGLPPGVFGPRPPEGTLFSNVTFFIGTIAFKDNPDPLKILSSASQGVPKAILRFRYTDLKIDRIDEKMPLKREVHLRTDLVEMPKSPGHRLLIYSVVDPLLGGARLITTFPVDEAFARNLLKPSHPGKPAAPHYNGYVQGDPSP